MDEEAIVPLAPGVLSEVGKGIVAEIAAGWAEGQREYAGVVITVDVDHPNIGAAIIGKMKERGEWPVLPLREPDLEEGDA